MLRTVYDTLDDIPEILREHAKVIDGKHVLDIDGMIPKKDLDEWRTNNRKLKAELDKLKPDFEALQAKYKDVDLDEYTRLKVTPNDIQKQLSEVETRLKAQFATQLAEERKARDAAEAKFHTAQIGNAVAMIAPKVGIYDTAIEDIQARATRLFRMVDGAIVAMKGDEPLYSDKEPSKLLGMEEWAGSLAKDFPHYFKASSGGGAGGGAGGPRYNGAAVIAMSDQKAFLANLEAIATGKVQVDQQA